MRTAPTTRSGRPGPSFPITIRPTTADVAVARAIARDTGPAPEKVARVLTWGADEKVLLVLAAIGWLASRGRGEPLRRAGNQALLVAAAATLLPHGMKLLFDQTRPDRAMLTASPSPASARTLSLQAMRCTWARLLLLQALCPPDPVGRSECSPSGSR